MTLQKVREVLRKNRWLRWQAYLAVVLVANGIRLVVTWPGPWPWWSMLATPVLFSASLGCMLMAVRLADIQKRQREVERAEAERLAKKAKELRSPRAPGAGPDQCPVCGGYGLDALAKDDAFMERGALAKVVAWGSRRAHWDCAEWSPYVEPRSNFATGTNARCTCRFCEYWCTGPAEAAKQELIAHSKTCPKRPRPATAFEIDGHPTYVGSASAREDLRLAAGATAGSRTVLLGGVAPGTMFLIQDAALRHMEIVTVTELGGGSRSGYGVSARLAEPLRHSFPADTKLTPFESKRLWNWTESRPWTRTELGMCDCGYGATRDPMLAQYLALDSARFEATLKSITDPESILRMLGKGF